MLLVTSQFDFGWSNSSLNAAGSSGTRPAQAMGFTVTASATPFNFGSWTTIIPSAGVTEDVYGIAININNGAAAGGDRRILMNIGIDTDGGTSFTTKIPNLIGGYSSSVVANTTGGLGYGCNYFFPIFIPAGSSIGAQSMSSNASAACSTYATIYGRPRNPEAAFVGTEVIAFGANTSTASGTAITLGTTSEGAWTPVGSALTSPCSFWQMGYTCADATMAIATIAFDLSVGNATTKKLVISNHFVQTTTTESLAWPMAPCIIASQRGVVGDTVYIRGQSSATPDSGTAVIAYGVV